MSDPVEKAGAFALVCIGLASLALTAYAVKVLFF